MPKRWCIGCGKLFDRDLTGTLRCPTCQPAATAQRNTSRNTKASTTQRGYGSQHQAERARLVAAFVPGQQCARCGKPITSADQADLGHTDNRTGYRGLEHAACNRGAESPRRRRRRRR